MRRRLRRLPSLQSSKQGNTSASESKLKVMQRQGETGVKHTDSKEYFKRYYKAHRTKLLAEANKYYRDNRERVKKRRRSLKLTCLSKYGEVCQCCGEDWPVFLTIDHIDGKGADHRKSLGGGRSVVAGSTFYSWLRKNNFPPGFQVLCFNCNFAKHINKICPHQSTGGRNP